jgi:predicted secreted protein
MFKMNAVSAVVVFILVWWCTLFCILPIGLATEHEEEGPLKGPGAPKHVNMKQKLILTTAVSAVIWLLFYLCISFDVINLKAVLEI